MAFFEEIRCVSLREWGFPYAEFVDQYGLHWALTDLSMNFIRPAQLGSSNHSRGFLSIIFA